MTAGIALSMVSLIMVILSQVPKLFFNKLTLPLFIKQLEVYNMPHITGWFDSKNDNDIGRGRTNTILRMAVFATEIPVILGSLFTMFLGSIFTQYVIVNMVSPSLIRLSLGYLILILIVLSIIFLFIQIICFTIGPTPVRKNGKQNENIAIRYWKQLKNPHYLTIHTSVILLLNIASIATAIGI